MGATETRWSIFPAGFSSEMPIFAGVSMLRVSVGVLWVAANLSVAEATYRQQECHAHESHILSTATGFHLLHGAEELDPRQPLATCHGAA
jgi:hypothetical protein